GVPVVNLEHLGLSLPHPQQENPFRPRQGEDRCAPLHLLLDIFPAIADRLQPTIRFLSHSPTSFHIAACSSELMDRMPSRERSLMVANWFFAGCTPPVAVSNTAAVTSSRLARVTACGKVIASGLGWPQRSRKLSTLFTCPLPEPEPA